MAQQEQKISVLDAAVVVVGIVFGSGIFVAPQIVAAFCGSLWTSLLAWPVGALVAISGSLCYAECISRVNAEGGFYSVFRHIYGETFASTAGIISQLVISPAALAGPITIGGAAASALVFSDTKHALACTLALLFIAALCNINGVHFSRTAQRFFVASKVLLVGLLLCACLVGRSSPSAFVDHVQPAALALGHWYDTALIAPFFGVLLWTFDGWTEVTMISGRLKNPGQDLSRALVLGLLGLAVIFMSVQGAVTSILGVSGTATSSQPFAAAIAQVFGYGSKRWVDGAIVLSTFTSAHGVMWMVSSLTRVMSQNGTLPRVLAKQDNKSGYPLYCVAFVTVLSALACLLDDFSTIVALFSFFIWVFYGLMSVAQVKLRRAGVGGPNAWRAPGGFFPPLMIAVVAVAMTASHLIEYPKACGIAVLLFGSVYLFRLRQSLVSVSSAR